MHVRFVPRAPELGFKKFYVKIISMKTTLETGEHGRRIPNPEKTGVFRRLKESIISGNYNLRELKGALTQESITVAQYAELASLLLEKLDKRVEIDALTGVFSRASLELKLNRLKEELNSTEGRRKLPVQSIMVIFLDIKEFKKLNDTHGHLAGDQALVVAAERFKGVTKRGDMIFRVGGDEFLIVLPITDNNPDLLQSIFQRIQEQINTNLSFSKIEPDGSQSETITFSISIGHEVLNRGDETTVKEILNKADQKMYLDKKSQ